jgi:beta-ureidopropionase / N-carbamoyl-L-amino-acid hydrolase
MDSLQERGTFMPMSPRDSLHIDGERLWDDLMALAAITEPDRRYTRRSFSPRFLDGRAWLAEKFAAAGLGVRIDAAGNLIGRSEGHEPGAGTIMVGSHSDTVPSGGRFDGMAGLLTGLEIARAIGEADIRLRHALEVVDFLAEEPSEFGLSCVGSRGMAGMLEAKTLGYRDPAGELLSDAIDRIGGDVAALQSALRRDIAAYFELHIEQGIVLERRGIDLGLVTAIAGITRLEIVFTGSADHAGSTPMALRRDALVAAAETVAFVAAEARRRAERKDHHFVATTGIIQAKPNAANVVPGEARILVDARSDELALVESFLADLDTASARFAAANKVERSPLRIISATTPATCDGGLRALLGESAASLGFSTMEITSGAGHDAAFISRIAPACMLFIPCRDGKSHAPEEWAEPAALTAGAQVIGEAVVRVDRGREAKT